MKVALVHDWLTGMRGGEKCLEVLCRRFPDAELFTLLHRPGRTSSVIDRMRITTSFLQQVPAIARHYRYWLPVMPRAAESLRIPDDVDLVVSFSHAVAKSVRAPQGVPHVCYCFTPMRYAWQLRSEYFDDSGKRRGPWSLARNALLDRIRDWDRATSDRVTHFVAISETIAGRIRDCYQRDSTVIYPPVDTDFYTPGQERRDDYYLCVSALVPYKKIELAVRACQQIGRKLVVIGAGPEGRKLARLGGAGIEWLGWRSNDEIREHLRRCRALLFPGQEDFGIVPLESQACGTPVIAYGRGGATETVLPADDQRIGSGVFFNEPTPAALADAMRWLEAHPTRLSGWAARRQAMRFSAERYETEMLAYLEWVMEGGKAQARRAA